MTSDIPDEYQKPDSPEEGDRWLVELEDIKTGEPLYGGVICHSPGGPQPTSWSGGPFDTLDEAIAYIDEERDADGD